MKRSINITIIFFALCLTFTITAQQVGSVRGNYKLPIPEKIQNIVLDPLPAGNYTVGTGGYFPTIDSAFNKLSIDGIAGQVILELTDDLYTAPIDSFGFCLNGPVPGAGPSSTVTIQPASNKNVTIEGNGLTAMSFYNTSYIIIDGIGLTGATTLTIHAIENILYTVNDCINFYNNSDHNIVKNVIFISEDYDRFGAGIAFWTFPGNTDTPDSNEIKDNFFKRGGITVYVSAYNATLRATGNIIKGNAIGSETDSLINWGIQVEHCRNTIIESNIVQNIKATRTVGDIINLGINSFYGYCDVIRNNLVFNMKSTEGYTCTGILLSGEAAHVGITNMVYNNMIYDIQSSSTQANSRVAGIQARSQLNPMIYYNSVYLSGSGANPFGSGALYIWDTSENPLIKNNVLINMRDESIHCAAAIMVRGSYLIIDSSDYNDLFYQPNDYNCLVLSVGGSYHSLEEWQATGWHLNSVSEMPNFCGTCLHIDETIPTLLEARGIPIAGIDYDFDGDLRSVTNPDIGADEFDGIVEIDDETVRPQEFALDQNYPNPFNPVTTIGFCIREKMNVKITVMNVIGEKVAAILNEERGAGYHQVEFSAVHLSSGVYFYRIEAGNFVQTKKMILLK